MLTFKSSLPRLIQLYSYQLCGLKLVCDSLRTHGLWPARLFFLGFSRQEYWSGLPYPSPGDLPNPGTEPGSPTLQADSLLLSPQGSPGEALNFILFIYTIRITRLDLQVYWEDNEQCMTQLLILCLTQSSCSVCWMKCPLQVEYEMWKSTNHGM